MNPFHHPSGYLPYHPSYRDISPPRNAHEMPRPGYHPADYRTTFPPSDDQSPP
ncbi:predicted protein [Plenodomus lingam JN3]|uniref:Predicted protein n=1 Tax=Leptosphaeria maculans (strain JN3 / isolate v23.1.3 / race Av1-4-5-6-7-8) TaxID=985895 RepID=E5AFR9_LEPMJ|nr:predicted protein [Plenodomus lingam JN3]CBY02058.1 predicted protein [Plenodomus lingam JN3]